jgi:hypothetical protein
MMQLRGLALCPEPGSLSRWRLRVSARDIPVLAPHPWLHLELSPVTARTSLLLLTGPDSGAPHFALIADSISRTEHIAPRHFRAASPGPFCQASIRLGDKWRPVLDVDALRALLTAPAA